MYGFGLGQAAELRAKREAEIAQAQAEQQARAQAQIAMQASGGMPILTQTTAIPEPTPIPRWLVVGGAVIAGTFLLLIGYSIFAGGKK